MKTLGILFIAALVGALGIWDLYAIWTGFRGGELWPFGWSLSGGLWHGLLCALLGLPLMWMLIWGLVAGCMAAWGTVRHR